MEQELLSKPTPSSDSQRDLFSKYKSDWMDLEIIILSEVILTKTNI